MIGSRLGIHMNCAICDKGYYSEDGDPVCPSKACQNKAALPTCDKCDERMDFESFTGLCNQCEFESEEEEE